MAEAVGVRAVGSGGHLERMLASGAFAVTAEIAPPASADPTDIREMVSRYRGAVDACNVTDCTRARVRLSSLAAATIAMQEGIEPVMQIVARDRNRIALQADLLGAAALGIRNVLCLWGDPVSAGNEPEAKGVFDLKTEEMIGATVPKHSMDRMEKAPDPKAEGVSIAVRTVKALRKIDGIRGVHLMPVGRNGVVAKVVKESGLLPRPEPSL